MKPVLFTLTLLLLASGCTTPLAYKSAFIGQETRNLSSAFKTSAAVYMGERDENTVLTRKPSTFTGSAVTYKIPLNSFVKEAFTAAFDKMCSGGAVSSSVTPAMQPEQLLIKPMVEAFDFKLSMAMFNLDAEDRVHVLVKLKVRVVIERGDGKKIVDKTVGSDAYVEYGKDKLRGEPDGVNKAITLEALSCAIAASRELKEALDKMDGAAK